MAFFFNVLLRVLTPLLLMTAAGLKLLGLSGSPFPSEGWLGHSWLQVTIAEWELLLGVWLLCSRMITLSWLAALVTFTGFAFVSAYRWINAAPDCGCFGAVAVPPLWTLLVDCIVLIALILSRPHTTTRYHCLGPTLRWSLALSGMLIAGTAVASISFSSPMPP